MDLLRHLPWQTDRQTCRHDTSGCVVTLLKGSSTHLTVVQLNWFFWLTVIHFDIVEHSHRSPTLWLRTYTHTHLYSNSITIALHFFKDQHLHISQQVVPILLNFPWEPKEEKDFKPWQVQRAWRPVWLAVIPPDPGKSAGQTEDRWSLWPAAPGHPCCSQCTCTWNTRRSGWCSPAGGSHSRTENPDSRKSVWSKMLTKDEGKSHKLARNLLHLSSSKTWQKTLPMFYSKWESNLFYLLYITSEKRKAAIGMLMLYDIKPCGI